MRSESIGTARRLGAESAASPARVLFVGNFLSARGGRRAVAEELEDRLAARGWSVTLTSRVLSRPARVLDMLWTTARRRADYDLAHLDVFSGTAFVWAEAAALLLDALGKPWVATLRGGELPSFARRHPRRVRGLLARARAVAAPSRYLQAELGVWRGDVALVPNAIDLSRYLFRARTQPAPRLVWVRAFHAMYRPELAPAVVAALAGAFADVRLAMIGPDKGDGSLAATVRAAEALGVADRVEIVPGVPKAEVPAHLGRGDVFLNTTSVDNVPVSVLEALACGLCVVSTNAGGLPYLLDDGRDALLVPEGDAAAMAGAVARVLREPGLAERLSRNGRETAAACDWAEVLPLWERFLQPPESGGAR
ncbi:MAG TPA: glycosyltransferase family 4 protein [Thermoanaerobaculia bacterium]|nr:glycosyltransferase family 4 protein [Thermoanaerobaculia bacterium]